jgi:hypothetical protein
MFPGPNDTIRTDLNAVRLLVRRPAIVLNRLLVTVTPTGSEPRQPGCAMFGNLRRVGAHRDVDECGVIDQDIGVRDVAKVGSTIADGQVF